MNKFIYIGVLMITPAGSTQRYYIAGGSGEEERQENTEEYEWRERGGF